jgi:anaerobic magnesium-protoporphyrin IX monomethyl ester cyclase
METNMKRVILLNPPSKNKEVIIRDNLYGCFIKGKAHYLWPPMHLAQLASVLEEANVECCIIDAVAERLGPKQAFQKIMGFKPDFIIIISATSTFAYDSEYVGEIKKRFKQLKSIFIGTHMVTHSQEVLDSGVVDFIILGEPEFVVRDLIVSFPDMKKLKKTPGLLFMHNGKTINTGFAPPIENLDDMPFPSRHLIPNNEYFNPLVKNTPYTTITTSRGCPFQCIYCVAGIVYGKRFRAKSSGRVVDEIEYCIKKYGIKEFFFRDETFTMNKQRVFEICKLIKSKKIKISWICASRVNTIDREMMAAMKDAGCHLIKFGVESGNQKILDTLKKGITLKQTRDVFQWANELGVDTVAHFMIGSPGETEKTIEDTIRFSKEIKPTYASFNITTIYPGTEMWEMYKHKIMKKSFSMYDIEKIHENAMYNNLYTKLSRKRIEKAYQRAYLSFYLRPGYIINRIIRQSSPRELIRSIKAGYHIILYSLKYKFSRMF